MKNPASHPEHVKLLASLQAQLAQWRTEQGDNVTVYLEETYVAPK